MSLHEIICSSTNAAAYFANIPDKFFPLARHYTLMQRVLLNAAIQMVNTCRDKLSILSFVQVMQDRLEVDGACNVKCALSAR